MSWQPPIGCFHPSDRDSQYVAEDYRNELEKYGLSGSIGRHGNPSDNTRAESFMKTLNVEEVHLMEYETFEDEAVSVWESRSRRLWLPVRVSGAARKPRQEGKEMEAVL